MRRWRCKWRSESGSWFWRFWKDSNLGLKRFCKSYSGGPWFWRLELPRSHEREKRWDFFVAFPSFLYFLVGAFLFAFDDDICLFFSKSHRSYNLKDLKPWVLLQLQYRKKRKKGKNNLVLTSFVLVVKLDRCQNFKWGT